MFLNFFKKTGSKLGLDLEYFAKNNFYLSVATATNILTGFILSILFARYLDKVTFGQYSFVYFLIGTFSAFAFTGLSSILSYAIAKNDDGFYYHAVKYTFLASLLGSIALLITSLYYTLPGKPHLTFTLFIAAIFFPLLNAFSLYSSVLTGKNLFKKQAFFAIAQAVFPNFLIILAIFIKPYLICLVLAGLFGQSILNVVFTKYAFSLLRNKNYSKGDLKYGLRLSFVWLLPLVAANFDKIVLAKFLGFEAVAIYTFATVLPGQLTNFLKNFQPLIVPKISKMSPHVIKRDVPSKTFQSMLFLIPIIAVYIILVPFVFKVFYPAYTDSIFPSQIFALSILFFPSTFLTQTFHRLRQITNTSVFTIFTSFPKFLFMFIFIPKFGINGAAISYVLSSALEFSVALFLVKRSNVDNLK